MGKEKNSYKEYLFVDGYNIINAWSNLRELSNISLEVAREELIDMMAEYQYFAGVKVVIVFDAHMVKGSSGKKENIKGVDVVYTKERETADQYIEKVIDEIGRVKSVKVATSDWMEQQIVLGRGGTRISARELEAQIEDMRRALNRRKSTDDVKNQMLIGGLDEETIRKLNKWTKNNK
jgi:hypothetical protein